jgi:hypothetical protein
VDIFVEFARAADMQKRTTISTLLKRLFFSATPPAPLLPAAHRLQPQPELLSPVAFPTSSPHTTPLPSTSVQTPNQAPALSLALGPVLPPSPSMQAPSPRDLQRQQDVRNRLPGKPGPKASSLIEMYRKKECQASGGSGVRQILQCYLYRKTTITARSSD